MKNKKPIIIYSILIAWILILVGVFALHIAIPIRVLFFIAFLCVCFLAWWTVRTIKEIVSDNKPTNKPSETQNESKAVIRD